MSMFRLLGDSRNGDLCEGLSPAAFIIASDGDICNLLLVPSFESICSMSIWDVVADYLWSWN